MDDWTVHQIDGGDVQSQAIEAQRLRAENEQAVVASQDLARLIGVGMYAKPHLTLQSVSSVAAAPTL